MNEREALVARAEQVAASMLDELPAGPEFEEPKPIAEPQPSGQILLHEHGHIAKGSHLASWRAKQIADIRWARVRAAREAALHPAPSPVVEAAPPSSAARKTKPVGPCDDLIIRPGQPMKVQVVKGQPFFKRMPV